MNIFFISYWIDPCGSFNGPIWSVSAEIFVYAVFLFIALSLSTSRAQWFIVAFSMTVVGVAFSKWGLPFYRLLGAPISCFFSGGLCFLLWERFHSTRHASFCMFFAAGALAISFGYFYAYGVQYFVLVLVTMPALILILAMLQSARKELGRSVRILGDITYSTYLLHFPLQLALILLVRLGWLTIDFSRGSTWVIYIVAVVVISVPSYYFFERPVQSSLRKLLLTREPDLMPDLMPENDKIQSSRNLAVSSSESRARQWRGPASGLSGIPDIGRRQHERRYWAHLGQAQAD